MASPLYEFEDDLARSSVRTAEQTRTQLRTFWRRLDGDPDDLARLEVEDRQGWQFLARFVADNVLSIMWYEEQRQLLQKRQERHNVVVVAVGLMLLGLAFLLPFQPVLTGLLRSELDVEMPASSAVDSLVSIAALVGVVLTGASAVLRLTTQVAQFRRQASVFHKASASLKEQLYRFESEWEPQALVEREPVRLTDEFSVALRDAIREAQHVLASERDEYFDTLMLDVDRIFERVDTGVSIVREAAASPGVAELSRSRGTGRPPLEPARSFDDDAFFEDEER